MFNVTKKLLCVEFGWNEAGPGRNLKENNSLQILFLLRYFSVLRVLLCCCFFFWFGFGAAFWIIDTINEMTIHGMYVRSHVYRLRMEKYTRLHIERNETKRNETEKRAAKERGGRSRKRTENTAHTQHGKRDKACTYMYRYVTHLYIMCSKPYEAYTIHNFSRTLAHINSLVCYTQSIHT